MCACAAPEVIANSRTYDGKLADVWSSGVMLYVMLFCEYPFERPEDASDAHRFQKVCVFVTLLPQGEQPQAPCHDLRAAKRRLAVSSDSRENSETVRLHVVEECGSREEAAIG